MNTGFTYLSVQLDASRQRRLRVKVAGEGTTLRAVVTALVDMYLAGKVDPLVDTIGQEGSDG